MKVLWAPQAKSDLTSLQDYIAADNPLAAQTVAFRIIRSVAELLSDNPSIGRPGRVSGTRELVVPRTPYLVPYRIQGDTLEVLRVYHQARRWPDRF